jgi:large subunit ribosomal protein L15
MVVRKRRKKNKLRGMRQHGAGDKKNRRGAGSRGGVGRAGSHKHKFTKWYMTFGIKRTRKAAEKPQAVNLDFINHKLPVWIESGKAKKEGEFVVVDGSALGFGKVLGKGKISTKIKLVNAKASASAIEKIKAVGGTMQGESIDEGFEEEEDEDKE